MLFAVVDWGTITGKDLVYAAIALVALGLGYRKVWCWYYQLEELRVSYQQQLDQERQSHREQLDQLRKDFVTQLAAAEHRADGWRDLVMEGRMLVQQSVTATVELSKRHAV